MLIQIADGMTFDQFSTDQINCMNCFLHLLKIHSLEYWTLEDSDWCAFNPIEIHTVTVKSLLIFIQMNLLPWTICLLIVGALSEGELHRPLAEIQKDFNAEIKEDVLVKFKRISTKAYSFCQGITWLQISVGMKNFSMAMLCIAGKSWIACSLQPSHPSRKQIGVSLRWKQSLKLPWQKFCSR